MAYKLKAKEIWREQRRFTNWVLYKGKWEETVGLVVVTATEFAVKTAAQYGLSLRHILTVEWTDNVNAGEFAQYQTDQETILRGMDRTQVVREAIRLMDKIVDALTTVDDDESEEELLQADVLLAAAGM